MQFSLSLSQFLLGLSSVFLFTVFSKDEVVVAAVGEATAGRHFGVEADILFAKSSTCSYAFTLISLSEWDLSFTFHTQMCSLYTLINPKMNSGLALRSHGKKERGIRNARLPTERQFLSAVPKHDNVKTRPCRERRKALNTLNLHYVFP